MTRLAFLQRLDVLAIESKTVEIGDLRRVTEFSDGQEFREFLQAVEVAGELNVAIRAALM